MKRWHSKKPIFIYPEKIGKCANKRLKKFALECKKNEVRSEVWFHRIYSKLRHREDRIGQPFQNKYIPDVANHRFKYIIEVDGSWHDQADVKVKDRIKDAFYKHHGYRVLRVIAYDKDSLHRVIEQLLEIRDIPYLRVALNNKRMRNR